MSPSLLSRCGVTPVQTQGRPLVSGPEGGADGGRIDGVAPGDVRLCLALPEALQCLVALMRSPWRNIPDGRRALDAP